MPRRRLAWPFGVALLAAIGFAIWHQYEVAHVQYPDPTVAPRDSGAPLQPLPLAPGAVSVARGVSGRVLTPDGAPAAGVRVALMQAITAWPDWQHRELGFVWTPTDGTFAFERQTLRSGLLLSFTHPQFAGDMVEVSTLLQRQTLQLQPSFAVEGFVQTPRGPLADCTVALEPALSDSRRVQTVQTNARGQFRFDTVPAGTVRLRAWHPRWQAATLPNVVVGGREQHLLMLNRPALGLSGRVVTATQLQRPLADVQVRAIAQSTVPGLAAPIVVKTDEQGGFRLDGLSPGTLRLDFHHPAHSTVTRQVVVSSNAPVELVEMPSRSQVRGVVRSALPGAGLPFQRGELLLRLRSGELAVAELEADGSFAFAETLPVGWATCELVNGGAAFAQSGARTMPVRIEEQPRTELDLQVVPASELRGVVTDEAGEPLADALVYQSQSDQFAARLRDASAALISVDLRRLGGQLSRGAMPEPETLLAVTDGSGVFRIRGMPSGDVALRIRHEGHADRRLLAQVPAAGEVEELTAVRLPAGCRIVGRVLRGGSALSGALVTASGAAATINAVSLDDGSFALRDVPPGSYRLRARWSTLQAAIDQPIQVAERQAEPVELVFAAGRKVQGRVETETGDPVAGAMVMISGGGVPTITDETGAFAIDVSERDVELRVMVAERNLSKTITVGAAETHVRVQLPTPPTGSLRARLLTLPQRSLPGAVLVKSEGLEPPIVRQVDLTAGVLSLPLCPVGRGRLRLQVDGHAPQYRDIDVRAGEERDLGEILFEPGATLAGMLVDADGKPVAGGVVHLGPPDDLELLTPPVHSEADGRFTIRGVCSAAAELFVQAPGFAPRRVGLHLPGDVLRGDPLRITLEAGTTIEVVLGDSGGTVVMLLQDGRVLSTNYTDADGIVQFRNCAGGDYVVQFGEDAGRSAPVSVDGSNTTQRLDVR